ncbi:hypothetical protein [Labrys neptuniae]
MVTSPIATLIQPALERGSIEDSEVQHMRQRWHDGGELQAADADALFALQGVLAGRNPTFNALFEEMLTAFVLDRNEPKGSISKEQGAWVLSMLDGGEGLVANAAELALLIRLVEQADSVPDDLASFALHQIQHAAMTGEGPAAKGRIHFSRVIDSRDIANMARLFQVEKGARRRIISRQEAEMLFDMAEGCNSDDPAWDGLFAETIQAHLLATNQPSNTGGRSLATPVVLADRDSAWLNQRIQHDGRVSRAERALLALVDPRQMAATNAWDRPISQMI